MRPGPSPITVGFGVTAVLVAGLVAYRLARSRGTPPASRPSVPSTSSAGGEASAAPPFDPPPRLPTTTLPALPDPVASAPEAAPARPGADALAPADLPDATAVATGPDAAARQRKLVLAAQNEALRREADERVFDSRNLPQTAREAIRRINEEFARGTRAYLERVQDAGAPAARGATSPEAEQLRRAALDSVLGPGDARVFEAAERVAARALAPRYRREWSRQLHEKTP